MTGGIGEHIHVPPHVLAGEVEERLGGLQDRRRHPGIAGALVGGDQEVGLRIEIGGRAGHSREVLAASFGRALSTGRLSFRWRRRP